MAHYVPQTYLPSQNQCDYNQDYHPHPGSEPTYIPKRVFIGGLPPNTTDAELTQFFSQFVHVVECKIVLNPDRAGRNFGFISVNSEADAELLKGLDERRLYFKDRKLNVASAMKKQYRSDCGNVNSSFVAASMNNSYSYMPMVPQQQQQYYYTPQNSHYMNTSIPFSPSGDEPNNGYNYYKNAQYAMVGQPCYDVNQNHYYPVHGHGAMNESGGVYSQYYHYPQTGYQMPIPNYNYAMDASYYPAPVERTITPVSPYVKSSSRSSAGSPPLSTPRDDKPRASKLSAVHDTPKTGKGYGTVKVKKSPSPELPVKLEPRKKGPDGRFRNADSGSQHYKFIRSPPSATKSLPDRPKPAGRVVQSLADKFSSMVIEKQDPCYA